MEQKNAKTYRIWYNILMVVGLVGMVDLATRSSVLETYNIDVGYAVIGVFFALKALFGTSVASSLSMWLGMILGLAPFWLGLAYFFNKKLKAVENPTEENLKKVKRSKVVLLTVGGIFLAIVFWGMFVAINANS